MCNIWYFKSEVWRCFWYVFRTQQVCGVWLQGGPRRTPPPPYHPPPLLRAPHVSPHPGAHPHHHAQVNSTNHDILFNIIVFVATFTKQYCYYNSQWLSHCSCPARRPCRRRRHTRIHLYRTRGSRRRILSSTIGGTIPNLRREECTTVIL